MIDLRAYAGGARAASEAAALALGDAFEEYGSLLIAPVMDPELETNARRPEDLPPHLRNRWFALLGALMMGWKAKHLRRIKRTSWLCTTAVGGLLVLVTFPFPVVGAAVFLLAYNEGHVRPRWQRSCWLFREHAHRRSRLAGAPQVRGS